MGRTSTHALEIIQIQHLLKLNVDTVCIQDGLVGIQIQHLLKLNIRRFII